MAITLQASLTKFIGLEQADLDKTIYHGLVSQCDDPLAIHWDLHTIQLVMYWEKMLNFTRD
ncbi:hypothetical protein [Umezakia ovalisporum]|uniref:Uncharacterized protein n=2 Tax=Umezakia ovalisporum TaxID=75695 RepID=A0AA43GZ12_9CYAN|nr:hypothetical protein [Umezakia ovalisporum]MBI1241865.1 hypothetical protein [Nostoc sp. RI_552]MDH6055424.1 hypothetical protein [Umezakia ovalisporum FSS-43]MDH6064156.1 hypothetical protein [Umezakia ovalisporum FSS-62]MDH6068503.1 hypothetical protein [Umezakia ovalisporum APH033B]MDH6069966.1 hypothetical protein [Umezakia ovalisporum CobakiLakeA]